MSKQQREYGDFLDDMITYDEKAERFVTAWLMQILLIMTKKCLPLFTH